MKIKKRTPLYHNLQAKILETGYEYGDKRHLPYYKDLYTVKNTIDHTKFGPIPMNFEFTEKNMLLGYIPSSNIQCLDLTNKNKKIVISLSLSVYHFLAEDLPKLLTAMSMHPDSEIILDVSNVEEIIHTKGWDFFNFFVDCLKHRNFKFKIIAFKKYEIVYINNFVVADFAYDSGYSTRVLYNFFKDFIDDKNIVPTKKVFVSRKRVEDENRTSPFITNNRPDWNDKRIDDHDLLEDYFKNLGFEIVYPEDFENFKHQITFFYSVKTIASLTSSGLTNAIFMQPGGNVIEIATPLLVLSPIIHSLTGSENVEELIVKELHMFYKNLAHFSNHMYISIPNSEKQFKILKKNIESNKLLLEILKHE